MKAATRGHMVSALVRTFRGLKQQYLVPRSALNEWQGAARRVIKRIAFLTRL